MNDLNLYFRIFKGHCHGNQFSFSVILFFCRNSKTTRDRHVVLGTENVGNFVFYRMAPSVMTFGDPESQNCFRFVLLLQVRFVQKVFECFLPFFPDGIGLAYIDDCCVIGLLSLKGRCRGNKFLSFSDVFRQIVELLRIC